MKSSKDSREMDKLRQKAAALEHQVKTLSERDARWQILVDSSPNALIMFDEANKAIIANRRVEEYFGIPLETVLGNSPDYFFESVKDCFADFREIWEHLQDTSHSLQEMYSGGFNPTHLFENGCRLIKPQPRTVFGLFFPLSGGHNGKTAKIYVFADITRFHHIEQSLRESEQRFRMLVENANDLIFSIDKQGKFSYISPNFSDITGHKPEEFIGQHFITLVHPEDKSRLLASYKSSIKTGEQLSNIGFRVQNKEGNWRWFTTTDSIVKDKEGQFQSVVSIAHDITELKRFIQELQEAHQDLNRTQAKLAQTEKMADLVRLITSITHEINTPLGAIKSLNDTAFRAIGKLKSVHAELLKDSYLEDLRLKAILQMLENASTTIGEGSERINKIVRTVRHFIRLDEAELKAADLHEGLEDTLTLLYPELKNRIRIKKRFGDLPLVVCHPGQINQVFHNILVDAAEAIKGPGEISIHTRHENQAVLITFQDTGEGIAEENLQKIFTVGFTTKGDQIGTGLGLAIAYNIIKEHQGDIKVESHPGKGSKFTVFLPVNCDKARREDIQFADKNWQDIIE